MVSARGKVPENGNWKAVHLSRSEVLELVYGKLQVIEGECSEIQDREAHARYDNLPALQQRLKRIAIEAKRCASLIETHTRVATAGHCIHCGKTYAEHDSDAKRREGKPDGLLPRKLANPAIDSLRCLALQRLFESVELDTYQPLPMVEVDLG